MTILLDAPLRVRLQQVMRTTQGREVLCFRGTFGERHSVVKVDRVGTAAAGSVPDVQSRRPATSGKSANDITRSDKARELASRAVGLWVDFHNTPSGISQQSAPPGVSPR